MTIPVLLACSAPASVSKVDGHIEVHDRDDQVGLSSFPFASP
jgi:hypothetical protein